MPERTLKQRKWGWLFMAVFLLLLSQIAWWAIVFSRYVDTVEELKRTNAQLQSQLVGSSGVDLSFISREAFRQKVMFFSESVFFALIASLALWLLFRALKTEERSREGQRNFIEVLTHESKTPLTALKLRLESIKEKMADSSLTLDVQRALFEVRRLTSIVEKALELNRLEMYIRNTEPLNLAELAEGIIKSMEPVFQQRQVQFISSLKEPVMVEGDYLGLRNTIQSLIENAVYYNDAQVKQVRLTVKEQNGFALVSVEDNGPGISISEETLVFERFYRGKVGKKIPGTGLGLYLSQQIVRAHRGVIRIIRQNHGAHFEIQIPLMARAL
ncbi:sensor histidine kinase [bacterium]|nr:sensor histidine kinase [bacterium]